MQTFKDIYSINTDHFYNTTEILDHIKNDLQLVAGGGYNTDHIYPVYFNIEEEKKMITLNYTDSMREQDKLWDEAKKCRITR